MHDAHEVGGSTPSTPTLTSSHLGRQHLHICQGPLWRELASHCVAGTGRTGSRLVVVDLSYLSPCRRPGLPRPLVGCGASSSQGPALALASSAKPRRRRLRRRGPRPAAARRASSASLASKASRTRQLRTTRTQVKNMVMALSPRSRHQPREMSLLAGSFDGRKAALGGAAPGVGGPPGGRGVIVFLGCLGVHRHRDGQGLLPAAGGDMLGRAEHRGPLVRQGHGRRPPGAAHFPHDGGAGHPVVTVFVVGTNAAQLVVGQLGRRLVMGSNFWGAGVAGQRHQGQQGRGCGRAVQVAIATDGPGKGAPGPSVGGVQVGHDLGPEPPATAAPSARPPGGRSRSRPARRPAPPPRRPCRLARARRRARGRGDRN